MAKLNNHVLHLPLVITGYTLFTLLVIAVLVSTTLPFGSILLHPNSIKLNVTVAMLALSVGALLPVLIGYFIGDRAVKSKSKLTHHFNGMLFGLLAYWLMTLIGAFVSIPSELFGDNNVRLIVMNIVPSIGIAIVVTILSVMHLRSKKAKNDVLEFTPFIAALVAAVVAMPVLAIINNIATNSLSAYTFFTPIMVAVFWAISFTSLRRTKLDTVRKVAWSTVSLSVLFVAVFVVNMFESSVMSYLVPRATMESQTLGSIIALIVAVVGWVTYWIYQVAGLRNGKK